MDDEHVAELVTRMAHDYALEQVAAGNWDPTRAEQLGRDEMARLLPQGASSPGMSLLSAYDAELRVGHVWLQLEPRIGETGEAWLYDIEVDARVRGRGYGRALLEAAEVVARDAGATYLGLNVFGANEVARALYESADYEVKTLQMRKRLTS